MFTGRHAEQSQELAVAAKLPEAYNFTMATGFQWGWV
jgi:hypothetical protein